MTIALYELAPTRSARVRWTLLELDIPFESVTGEAPEFFRSPELRAVHPLGKVPALVDNGRKLFESAAICNWLADSHPEKGLIAPSGSFARALHDRWVAFTLSELEAYLWSTARNTFIYPEAERLPAVFEQNAMEARRALAVFDDHLADAEWLVDGRFSVTDIFAGFALNWARMTELTANFAHVRAYLDRLLARPLCPYRKD
ncbi:MAG: glutathione S-transferase family protein [Pseudomonadota bacterium]|nr:glutathione S-transferase family protein [Pseudomonadota bacterium]